MPPPPGGMRSGGGGRGDGDGAHRGTAAAVELEVDEDDLAVGIDLGDTLDLGLLLAFGPQRAHQAGEHDALVVAAEGALELDDLGPAGEADAEAEVVRAEAGTREVARPETAVDRTVHLRGLLGHALCHHDGDLEQDALSLIELDVSVLSHVSSWIGYVLWVRRCQVGHT